VAGRLEAALRAAVTFLDSNGYSYAIVGGIALAQWGVIRATGDIDIKVLVPESDDAAARRALRSAFAGRSQVNDAVSPFIVDTQIEGVTVDFLLALPGYEEVIIERAVRRELDDLAVWFCAPDDLVIQKIYADREKDWTDVEALLVAQRDRLDNAYIEGWVSQFAEALEKPELLARYRGLWAKIWAM
jgi:hypothetical protein